MATAVAAAAAAAAAVSKESSYLKETSKAMTYGHGKQPVKTVKVEEVSTMDEVPDYVLRGNRRNAPHKLTMATSVMCRGGLYSDKKGVGTIVYGSFEGDHLQY